MFIQSDSNWEDPVPERLNTLSETNPSVFGLLCKGLPSPAGDFCAVNDRVEFFGPLALIGWLELDDDPLLLDLEDGTVWAAIGGLRPDGSLRLDAPLQYVNGTLAAFYRCADIASTYHSNLDDPIFHATVTGRDLNHIEAEFRNRLHQIDPGCAHTGTWWADYVNQFCDSFLPVEFAPHEMSIGV